MKQKLKLVFSVFPVIMSCVSLAAAAYICLFWETDTSSGAELIWQLALCSFLCSFSALFAICGEKRELGKRALLIRMALAFVYVNVVVMTCGFAFDWFHIEEWRMLLGMELTIAAVYAVVSLLLYRRAQRDAAQVNERLRRREG